VTSPFPGIFDPAGFLKTASVRQLRRWREAELTHGRVAMLAAVGFVIGEQLEDFPAFMNFGTTPGSLTRGNYRAGGRVHTPSRVAPHEGHHQLPQGSSTHFTYLLYARPHHCVL